MSYLKRHGTRRVPQWAPLPGQAPNSAAGFAWTVDAWTRLRRFLVLGSEGGSYYASESTLTREHLVATLLLYRMLYFVIPFMIAITILGTRELWLNVVQPWRRGRLADESDEPAATTAIVQPLKRRARG